jgi:hypothetical protein
MSSRSSGSGGSSSGGAGATVPLSVLLRREVASERTAAERPELQTGLFCQAKKGEDFTFLKPECERIPGVPSSSFSAFGVSVPTPPFSDLSFPSRSRAPIWRHVDRWRRAIGFDAQNVVGGDAGQFFVGVADFRFFCGK